MKRFPIYLPPALTYIISIPQKSSTSDKPVLTRGNGPESIVDSFFLVLYLCFGQMYNNMYPSLWYTKYSHCPWNHLPSTYSFLSFPATTHLFSVSVTMLFPGCDWVGISQWVAFSSWLLSCRYMIYVSIHVCMHRYVIYFSIFLFTYDVVLLVFDSKMFLSHCIFCCQTWN